MASLDGLGLPLHGRQEFLRGGDPVALYPPGKLLDPALPGVLCHTVGIVHAVGRRGDDLHQLCQKGIRQLHALPPGLGGNGDRVDGLPLLQQGLSRREDGPAARKPEALGGDKPPDGPQDLLAGDQDRPGNILF